ncbi:MAG: hypothetical protein Q9192_000002 [Flavoplaca navasiana]
MFNAPEVTNEYNLLNDFLSTSLLDDDSMFSTEDAQVSYPSSSLGSIIAGGTNGTRGRRPSTQNFRFSGASQAATAAASEAVRPPSVMPTDKARETYYMTAADPAGSDTPEERMEKLLKAKYDAGMLRPFNYVKGYARLNQYMDKHMQSTSRQKILRGLDRFRPKFRERMQTLTDMQLVRVEMWFERSLMEYDRVFASMAIPACCWRRTGEIFRGNKEMAELIHVPVEQLRDGKLAIHEIIVEDHLVSYWEKFEGIAFDTTQKAMLTSCSLKNPNLNSSDSEIRCCFSFTIRRDIYDIPSLIVGNFLPMEPDALLEQIEGIALVSSSALVDKIRDFDERGTRIWNLASKLKNDAESGATLAQGQLSITERIVERAAAYEQRLRKGSQIEKDQDSEVRVRRMSAEYHVLRITLAWRQGRLDLAEIWLANMNLESRVLEPSVAERLADTVYEIGRDQLTKGCYQWALQWLDRAHDILASQNPEELSADSSEVQNCIMHTTIRVLLKTRDEESISRAWNIYHELEGETKNKLMLWLLKLELLGADQSGVQDYYEALDGVVRQIHLSDVNLAMILHHVHELRRRNARLAHAVLAVLLSERVLIMDQIAWVERTLVTIIWNCTTSPGLSTMTDTLEELLDTIVVKTDTALSTSATHAAQIVSVSLRAYVCSCNGSGPLADQASS